VRRGGSEGFSSQMNEMTIWGKRINYIQGKTASF